MQSQTSDNAKKYLYAIVRESPCRDYGPIGLDDTIVYSISAHQLAGVVSDVPNAKLRPERRHLAAHQGVLKRLMQECETVLPISFGIIAVGSKAVRKILTQNREDLMEQLRCLDGKVEMGLHVRWDVPNIFEYFICTHPELRAARDRFLGRHREPTQEDKIEIGRMFDQVLNEDREVFAEKVEQALSEYCFQIKRNKCRNELEVINLACLVGRNQLSKFEAAVFEAARLFDNNFSFDYNGPWAPHNFVEIDLKLEQD